MNQQPVSSEGRRLREFCLEVIVFPIWHSGCTQKGLGRREGPEVPLFSSTVTVGKRPDELQTDIDRGE